MTSAESVPVDSDDPFTVVYTELRRIAAGCLADEGRVHTLSPTALVHEAWLRLQGSGPERFAGIRSMKALAALAMRQILIEYGRRKRRRLRLLQHEFSSRSDSETVRESGSTVDLLDLDDALTALAPEYPEHARLVELRYFGGLSLRECAEELGVCERTVDRHWQFARAWLNRRLQGST